MRPRVRTPAIIAVQLDPIGAVPDLVANHADQAIHAIGLFGALRDAPLERKTLGRVTTGGDDGAGGSENSRPGNDALVDGLLEFHIRVTGAFGSEIAHGSESGEQGGIEMVHGARHAQRQAFMRHLVVPRGFIVWVQEHVRVAFNQARHESEAGKIDDLGAGGGIAFRASRFDAVAFDADGPIVVHRVAVKDPGRFQHDDGLRLSDNRKKDGEKK
jgi:hypothetical protein